MERRTTVKLAELNIRNATFEKESEQLSLINTLLEVTENIYALSASISLAKELATWCQKSYWAAEEKYRIGFIHAYELNHSKDNYYTALIEYHRLCIQQSMNHQILSLYINGIDQ
jgi:hypothetical protein